jgi:tetratricopeptide (TPR) repeat protein
VSSLKRVVADTPPSDHQMGWKERGDYHLDRKEIHLAIGSYTRALQDAERGGNFSEVIDSLKNIGRAFLAKAEPMQAAKTFNCAMALCEKHDPQNAKSIQAIFSLMAEAEKAFLDKECGVKSAPQPQTYVKQREQLQALRQDIHEKIKQGCSAREILAEFSKNIRAFFESMLEDLYLILGKPPCESAWMSLGSLGRNEMSPFSDLEFALLVAANTPANLLYFRRMVKCLEMRVINLGETEFKILNNGHESPTVRGFSFDDGGNTPLGKQGYVELVATPKDLSRFQSEKFYKEDLILSNVLRTSGLLSGSKVLHQEYVQAVNGILSGESKKLQLTARQERALNILAGHLTQFEPKIDSEKEKTPVFNIKEELYRLPTFLIAGLADYFGIERQSTWDKLDALVAENILSDEGAGNLSAALSDIMSLRIRSHLHYGQECDEAFHPSMDERSLSSRRLNRAFILQEADIEKIKGIYRVLLPLHRRFKEICATGDFAQLKQESFYDDSMEVQAEACKKLGQYSQCKECFQKALALNPDDTRTQLEFAQLLWELGEHSEARQYLERAQDAIESCKELLPGSLSFEGRMSLDMGDVKGAFKAYATSVDVDNTTAGSLSSIINIGTLYFDLGRYDKAQEVFEKLLPMIEKVYGHKHARTALCLSRLGMAARNLGKVDSAIKYHEEALQLVTELYGNRHPSTAYDLHNLGISRFERGDVRESIRCFEEALEIWKTAFGDKHTLVATCLSNLSAAWLELGDAKKAIAFLEESARIERSYYGDDHPNVAITLANLGMAWKQAGDAEAAVEYLEEASKILEKFYHAHHPWIAKLLNSLGSTWCKLGFAEKAIEYCEASLRINRKVYGDRHSSVAICLNNLGLASGDLGEANKAIAYHEEALGILKEVYGDEHPRVGHCLTSLGFAWGDLGDQEKAIEYLSEALKLGRKCYGNRHPTVADRLTNLSCACREIGDYEAVRRYLEGALEIIRNVYGDEHREVAGILYDLGLAWRELGKPEEAIGCLEECLAIRRKLYGHEHPDVATCCYFLSDILMGLGSSQHGQKAVGYSEEALRINKLVYGDEHPFVLDCLQALGRTWLSASHLEKARECFEEVLSIGKKLRDGGQDSVANSLFYLGAIRIVDDELDKAIDCFKEALEIRRKMHGNEHPSVAATLEQLGEASIRAGKDEGIVIRYFEEALDVCRACGESCDALASNINATLIEMRKVSAALNWLEHADVDELASFLQVVEQTALFTSGQSSDRATERARLLPNGGNKESCCRCCTIL